MHASQEKTALGTLAFAALGIVFGDIGTSPLYTLKECFSGHFGLMPTPENVIGILSLVFWSILLVVSLKYVSFVLLADNRGEGGIMALMALARRKAIPRWQPLLIWLGIAGAALFYGDAVITPAISVLSATEGLEIAAPSLERWELPLALGVLLALFMLQKHGTARVGMLFGPVMLLWFAVLAALGAMSIAKHPEILVALNPLHGLHFVLEHGKLAFLALGAVVLALTGAEALYADMGHFGRPAIRLAWFAGVLPALVLNYFGQGALLLANPESAENPFFLLAPEWGRLPLTLLATVATVIASQAVISGAFSLTRQAVQLGYCPRVHILHTSAKEIGQIYIPVVNWSLLAAVVVLILSFHSSSNLAAAYGIAVTGTMVLTTILACVVARTQWKWPLWLALSVTAVFLFVDIAFFAANALKIFEGGWLPLAMGATIFLLFATWKRGRNLMTAQLEASELPLQDFVDNLCAYPPAKVPGTAVFMSSSISGVPHALLHNLKHNKVLHERVVFLTIRTEDIPIVSANERIEVTHLGTGFWQMQARYGFLETPDIPHVLEEGGEDCGLTFESMDTSYFLSRETLIASRHPGMPLWRVRLFSLMSRNALKATDFFKIPPNRVVEMGTQVEI